MYRCTFTEDAGATTIKTGAGALEKIVVGSTPAKAIEIYDSAGSGGTKLGELAASCPINSYGFECNFAAGLHISNPGGAKLSIIWR